MNPTPSQSPAAEPWMRKAVEEILPMADAIQHDLEHPSADCALQEIERAIAIIQKHAPCATDARADEPDHNSGIDANTAEHMIEIAHERIASLTKQRDKLIAERQGDYKRQTDAIEVITTLRAKLSASEASLAQAQRENADWKTRWSAAIDCDEMERAATAAKLEAALRKKATLCLDYLTQRDAANARVGELERFLDESRGDYRAEKARADRLLARIAELEREVDRLKIYELEQIATIKAIMWMHDDPTLDIKPGERLTVQGIAALRKQRDDLRQQLAEEHAELLKRTTSEQVQTAATAPEQRDLWAKTIAALSKQPVPVASAETFSPSAKARWKKAFDNEEACEANAPASVTGELGATP